MTDDTKTVKPCCRCGSPVLIRADSNDGFIPACNQRECRRFRYELATGKPAQPGRNEQSDWTFLPRNARREVTPWPWEQIDTRAHLDEFGRAARGPRT